MDRTRTLHIGIGLAALVVSVTPARAHGAGKAQAKPHLASDTEELAEQVRRLTQENEQLRAQLSHEQQKNKGKPEQEERCQIALKVDFKSGGYGYAGDPYWTIPGKVTNKSNRWVKFVSFNMQILNGEGRVIGTSDTAFQVARIIKPKETALADTSVRVKARHQDERVERVEVSLERLTVIDENDDEQDGSSDCEVRIEIDGNVQAQH